MKIIFRKSKLQSFFLTLILLFFIHELNAQNCIWSKGATGTGSGYSITTDPAGNTYMLGTFTSATIAFDSITLTNNNGTGGTTNLFLVKYDSSGKAIWARSAGASPSGYPLWARSITSDAFGNIYLAGAYSMGIYFGTDTLNSSALLMEMYVAKYDTSGNKLWVKSFGEGGNWQFHGGDIPISINCNRLGQVLIAGYFNSDTLNLGTSSLINRGGTDVFVMKLNSSGTVLWAKSFGGGSVDYGHGVATDSIGNIYLAGSFGSPSSTVGGGGSITFGTITLSNHGGFDDMFVAKLDGSGNVVWAKGAGGSMPDRSNTLAIYKSSVYVAGYFSSSSIVFDTITLTNSSIYSNFFLTKYDTSGNVQWARKGAASGNVQPNLNSLATDENGNAYVCGWDYGVPLNFGTTYSYYGGGFVVRYTPSGTATWANNPCWSTYEGLSLDKFGNIYTAGTSFVKTSQCGLPNIPGSITGNSSICGNSVLNYSVTPITGALSYTWTLPNGFTGTSTSNSISVTAGNNSGNISVTANNVCGNSPARTLPVGVFPWYSISNPRRICGGSSYTFNSHTYTTTNTYYDTLHTVNSCDSIFVTSLIVDSSYLINNPRSICTGGSYIINSHTYTTANTYYDTLHTTAHSCDSIIKTVLTVNPKYNISNPQTICNGGSYFINSHTYTLANTYYDTLQSVNSCDSVIVTTLTVIPKYLINNPQTICNGNYYRVNNHFYFTANTYYDTLQSIYSCDSIIKTILTVGQSYTLLSNPVINLQMMCPGGAYHINGHTYTAYNNYVDTLHTVCCSCDSIVITQLNLYPTYNVANSQNICFGGSYTFNNHTYKKQGAYYDTLRSVNSCDSVISTWLWVGNPPTGWQTQTICPGGSYTFNSHTYKTAGLYYDTIRASNNICDSIIGTTIMINSIPTFNNPQTICSGHPYMINNHTYATPGTYYDTLKSVSSSCDSLNVTTIITLNSVSTFNNPQTICYGSSYKINNHTYTTPNTYRDTLKSVLTSCDSAIFITNLTVTAALDTSVSVNGNTLMANGSNVTYQWFNCTTKNTITGATGKTYIVTVSGSYSVIVTQNSCSDTSYCRSVVIVGLNEIHFKDGITIYPNPSGGKFMIETKITNGEIIIYNVLGEKIYSEKLQQRTSTEIDISTSPKGIYFIKLSDGEKIYNQKIVIE